MSPPVRVRAEAASTTFPDGRVKRRGAAGSTGGSWSGASCGAPASFSVMRHPVVYQCSYVYSPEATAFFRVTVIGDSPPVAPTFVELNSPLPVMSQRAIFLP